MRKAYAFSGGLLLAWLQFCFFLLLERQLSSAWMTYMTVTLAWMAGIFLGLQLRSRGAWMDPALLGATLLAYYVLRTCLAALPFETRALPIYGLCVLVSGAYAGRFFRAAFGRMKSARELLLHENNGFLAGLASAFFLFSRWGRAYLAAGPAAAAASVFLLGNLRGFGHPNPAISVE